MLSKVIIKGILNVYMKKNENHIPQGVSSDYSVVLSIILVEKLM